MVSKISGVRVGNLKSALPRWVLTYQAQPHGPRIKREPGVGPGPVERLGENHMNTV